MKSKLLLAAMMLLALITFGIGVVEISERQHLLEQGKKTKGIVVGINFASRGIRSVEAQFATLDDQMLVGRDIHKSQWSSANEIGDRVILHYDPQEPEKILISRGLWIWSNPAFMLLGGVFVVGLGVFLYRQ